MDQRGGPADLMWLKMTHGNVLLEDLTGKVAIGENSFPISAKNA